MGDCRDGAMKKSVLHSHACRIFVSVMLFSNILVVVHASAAPRPFSHSIQFIYIDANIGNSSGGHTALRLGEIVYHFQIFPDGFFRIVRDHWPYFRYIYNDLENRTLHLAQISVSAKTFKRVKRCFNRRYLIQETHMKRLNSLQADITLLADLSMGKRDITVKGAGLFSRKIGQLASGYMQELRCAVTFAHGKNFLEKNISDLDRELANISINLKVPETDKISTTAYPPAGISVFNIYQQNRLKRAALSVIQRSLSVNSDEFRDISSLARPGAPTFLTVHEQKLFSVYAGELMAAIVKLPVSKRPDWGYPLLIAIARYQAVQRSLDRNRLILLDPFPTDAQIISDKNQQTDPAVMDQLTEQSRQTYLDIRKKTFSDKALGERSYNLLEESGGRYAELEKGRQTGASIKVAYGRLIPSKQGPVALPPESLYPTNSVTGRSLAPGLAYLRLAHKAYRQQLKAIYPYDIFNKNCATELLRLINKAFNSEDEISQALGGYIQPGTGSSYIPFRLYALVRQQFRIQKTMVLPSYRKRMITRMYTDNTIAPAVYFREFNTLSSSIYKHLPDDTPFLFFTDDVIWPRPLYGVVNTAYGGMISVAGLFTWPVDHGSLAGKGLRGMLFSLPELFFCNIRKGSFNYVSDSAAPGTDDLEYSAPAFNRYVSP